MSDRAEFEVFAKDRGLSIGKLPHGDYRLFSTGEAYAAWQAARAQQSAEGRRVHEPFGTESAYQEAKGRLMGSNMNISCALVSELVEGFRLLNSSPADKPDMGGEK